jgi:hypothetical protein
MNLKSPHVLRFTYLQHMFASYLLQPKQSKVLIVGLGGGSMVHFLQKHDPTVAVDAVEIDPVVVQLYLLHQRDQLAAVGLLRDGRPGACGAQGRGGREAA